VVQSTYDMVEDIKGHVQRTVSSVGQIRTNLERQESTQRHMKDDLPVVVVNEGQGSESRDKEIH